MQRGAGLRDYKNSCQFLHLRSYISAFLQWTSKLPQTLQSIIHAQSLCMHMLTEEMLRKSSQQKSKVHYRRATISLKHLEGFALVVARKFSTIMYVLLLSQHYEAPGSSFLCRDAICQCMWWKMKLPVQYWGTCPWCLDRWLWIVLLPDRGSHNQWRAKIPLVGLDCKSLHRLRIMQALPW